VDAVAGDAGAQRVAVSTVEVGNTVGETVGLDFEAKAAGELDNIPKQGLVSADGLLEVVRVIHLRKMSVRVEQASEHCQAYGPGVVQVHWWDTLQVALGTGGLLASWTNQSETAEGAEESVVRSAGTRIGNRTLGRVERGGRGVAGIGRRGGWGDSVGEGEDFSLGDAAEHETAANVREAVGGTTTAG
jgi:hypothetical protein